MVHRIASYLPSATTYGGGGELTGALSGQLHVAQAALRATRCMLYGRGYGGGLRFDIGKNAGGHQNLRHDHISLGYTPSYDRHTKNDDGHG
ncbi:hypothetical protein AHF37_08835 [Paragonimus kellicotti]|nr:hypothetical protein AHF37_08835 [Paragonimus kellicotti]